MNSQTLGVDMDPVTTAALVSGGSQILGSLLGGKPQVRHDSAHGETEGAIRAKMEAAEKYGISKLYALGAPAVGGSTTVVGGDTSLGSAISNMGADVSRAVAARQTAPERALQALTLEKAALENDYLRAQINSLNARVAQQTPPSVPGLVPEKVQDITRTQGANLQGSGWWSNPLTSDWGQYLEDRIGDDNPLSWPIGAAVLLSDLDYNLSRLLPAGYGSPAEAGRSVRELLGF